MIMYHALDKTKEINRFRDVVIPTRRELFETYGNSLRRQPSFSIGADDEATPLTRSNNTIDQLEEVQKFLNKADSADSAR